MTSIFARGPQFSVEYEDDEGSFCPRCDEFVPFGEQVETEAKGSIHCPECGLAMNMKPPPDKMFENALQTLGAQDEDAPEPPDTALVMSCPVCGAGLEVSHSTGRLLKCEYCENSVCLSDDVWWRLHYSERANCWAISWKGPGLVAVEGDMEDPDWFAPVDTVPDLVSVSLLWRCRQCGAPNPVNGPVRVLRCNDCGATVEISPDTLARVLAESAEGSRTTFGNSGLRVSNRHDIDCPGCGHTFALGADGTPPCPQCGHAISPTPVPDWLKVLLPEAVATYGAESEEHATSIGDTGAESFVISCPVCGDNVQFDPTATSSSSRSCESCGADVIVPEDVWRRYNPLKKARFWTLVYRPPSLSYMPSREAKKSLGSRLGSSLRGVFQKPTVLTLRLHIPCTKCGRRIPVNGPDLDLTCRVCLHEMELTEDGLASAIAAASQDAVLFSSDYTVSWSRDGIVACSECGRPITVPVKQLAAARSVSLRCPQCGTEAAGGPPAGWFRDCLPGVLGVFNAETEIEDGPEEEVSTPGEADVHELSCPGCKAGLRVDEDSSRTMRCEHCGAEVYIPDSIWCSMNPGVKARSWAVVYKNEELEAVEADDEDEDD